MLDNRLLKDLLLLKMHRSLRLEILQTTNWPLNLVWEDILNRNDWLKKVLSISLEVSHILKLVSNDRHDLVHLGLFLNLLLDLSLQMWRDMYEILDLLLLSYRLFICIVGCLLSGH